MTVAVCKTCRTPLVRCKACDDGMVWVCPECLPPLIPVGYSARTLPSTDDPGGR